MSEVETVETVDPAVRKAEREAEKSAAFKKVAARRTNAALKQIELLRNTTDTSNYSHTPEQAERIISALRAGVDALEAGFAGSSKSAPTVEL